MEADQEGKEDGAHLSDGAHFSSKGRILWLGWQTIVDAVPAETLETICFKCLFRKLRRAWGM
eukprot:scaffold195257_cov17-Tisochrysis_lutea.AAC.1